MQSLDDVAAYVGRTCFKTGPPSCVGAELEWLTVDVTDPRARVHPDQLASAIDALPAGSALSFEPGGQVELSSPPGRDLAGCIAALRADVQELRGRTARAGIRLEGRGLDPVRPPERVVHNPRYDAMQAYFDAAGDAGRTMMTCTAAVQVCLDAAPEQLDRWQLVHDIGPTMMAAFANSPRHGYRCAREAIWQGIDRSRTAPALRDGDALGDWTDYVLDARVMLIRGEHSWQVDPGCTLREWVLGVPGLRTPTLEDVSYHISTLFPPVRARGWYELRMIDAQRGDDWVVPIAVVAALVDDPQAADAARAAVEPVRNCWVTAARQGLANASLAGAARTCFAAALRALPKFNVDNWTLERVTTYFERYVEQACTPADIFLEPTWS